jgi:BASS family bile acid:Na+ symporter
MTGSKQHTTKMQASIIYSPLPTKFIKFRTISSKQNPTFHQTTPCSHLKLCNFQTQSPLNISTLKSLKIFISNLGPLRCGISSNSESAKVGGTSFREWLEVAGEAISTAFPLWVTIVCVLGLLRPNLFNWVTPKLSIVGLSVTMLGMGMTLSVDDLLDALSMPKEVLTGFFLQYSVSTTSSLGSILSKLD